MCLIMQSATFATRECVKELFGYSIYSKLQRKTILNN